MGFGADLSRGEVGPECQARARKLVCCCELGAFAIELSDGSAYLSAAGGEICGEMQLGAHL